MSDVLRMNFIISLPQPLKVEFCGGDIWPLYYICAETGLMKIDVYGTLENKHIGEVRKFIDADGYEHDVETFFSDYEEGVYE